MHLAKRLEFLAVVVAACDAEVLPQPVENRGSRRRRRSRAQKKFPQGVLIDLPHSGIMAVQAIQDAAERGHLIGDVPVLAIVGIVLIVLAPKSGETAVSGEGPG